MLNAGKIKNLMYDIIFIITVREKYISYIVFLKRHIYVQ